MRVRLLGIAEQTAFRDGTYVRNVPISALRADSFALLRQVEKTKKPVRITRFGQPLAEIHPLSLKELKIDLVRAARDARDMEIINHNADRLNAEAEDALEYQAPWDLDEPKKRRTAGKKRRTR